MDAASFLDFHRRGLSQGAEIMGQTVVVTTSTLGLSPVTLTFNGVLSDVEIDPEELKEFGFNVKRVFTLRVTDLTGLDQLKVGMTAVEPGGEQCRLLHFKKSRFGMTLWFGSVNR
jgi:hypothetical protein